MTTKKAADKTRGPVVQEQRRGFKRKKPQKHYVSANGKTKKALVVAKEIKLARLLAGNDQKVRDKVLRYLKKWLTARAKSSFAFTEADFMRLWRGLFYCMWLSDKLLVQEELAEDLSKLVYCFVAKEPSLLYIKCALQTLSIEWFGIDKYRLDKFSMLVRRIIRRSFEICKEQSHWKVDWIHDFSNIVKNLLLTQKSGSGFNMHIIEIFWEELAKVSGGDIPTNIITILLKPFTEYFIRMDEECNLKHIMKHIFRYLILQSDIGLEYSEKFEAWRQAGFPTGHIDAMQEVKLSDAENDSNDEISVTKQKTNLEVSTINGDASTIPLDPRAGRVNVELSQIQFDASEIVQLLTEYKFHPSSTAKSRRQLQQLIKEFTELAQGRMPLGIKEVKLPDKGKGRHNTMAAALRLLEFERDLYSDNPLSKRKKKRGKYKQQLLEDSDTDSFSDETADNNMEINNDDIDENYDQETRNDLLTRDREEVDAGMKKASKKKIGANEDMKGEESALSEGLRSVHHNDRRRKRKRNAKTGLSRESTQGKDWKIDETNGGALRTTDDHSPLTCASKFKSRRKVLKQRTKGGWDVSENVNPVAAVCLTNSVPLATDNEKLRNTFVETASLIAMNGTSTNEMPLMSSILNKLHNKQVHEVQNGVQTYKSIEDDPTSKKRVKIVLHRNTAQHTSEYLQKVRQSPGIPFDAAKKPAMGVLKASPIPSPINPFYQRN